MTKRTSRDLNSAEKVLFRRISRDLQQRGTFDQIPAELLLDYVHLDTRINDLRAMAAEMDDPKLKLGAFRQLEAAVTQRRQLANCLFPAVEVGKKTLRNIAAQEGAGGDWVGLIQ